MNYDMVSFVKSNFCSHFFPLADTGKEIIKSQYLVVLVSFVIFNVVMVVLKCVK